MIPLTLVLRKSTTGYNLAKELKEHYPVTAHAPNFDFRTGCREIKRCEESKRTLKNPFASRFAEFNTTLKLLRITDQWYIVPVKLRFGRNLDFFGVTFIAVGRRSKWLEALWCRLKAYLFHTSSDNCERNSQKWNNMTLQQTEVSCSAATQALWTTKTTQTQNTYAGP